MKYIVLPDNSHETADFVRKCHQIGLRRVSFDLDCNPFLFGIPNSLTDEIIEAIAVLIHEAKRRKISVYSSGSGTAVWLYENGHARVQAALDRISAGRFKFEISESGFVMLNTIAHELGNGTPVDWGRRDDVNAVPLNSVPGAIFLQENQKTSFHRIEQMRVPVSAGEPCTVEVVARPAGRNRIMIELRDAEDGRYIRAKYDLKRQRVIEGVDGSAAMAAFDLDWVRCQLTLTPASSSVVFNVTLLDERGAHVYPGTGQDGIHVRPLSIQTACVADAA